MYKNNTPTVYSKGIQDLSKIYKYCNGRMKKALHVYIRVQNLQASHKLDSFIFDQKYITFPVVIVHTKLHAQQ